MGCFHSSGKVMATSTSTGMLARESFLQQLFTNTECKSAHQWSSVQSWIWGGAQPWERDDGSHLSLEPRERRGGLVLTLLFTLGALAKKSTGGSLKLAQEANQIGFHL